MMAFRGVFNRRGAHKKPCLRVIHLWGLLIGCCQGGRGRTEDVGRGIKLAARVSPLTLVWPRADGSPRLTLRFSPEMLRLMVRRLLCAHNRVGQ